jgi:hypothetical protein
MDKVCYIFLKKSSKSNKNLEKKNEKVLCNFGHATSFSFSLSKSIYYFSITLTSFTLYYYLCDEVDRKRDSITDNCRTCDVRESDVPMHTSDV